MGGGGRGGFGGGFRGASGARSSVCMFQFLLQNKTDFEFHYCTGFQFLEVKEGVSFLLRRHMAVLSSPAVATEPIIGIYSSSFYPAVIDHISLELET